MVKKEEYGLDAPSKILPILLFMVAGGSNKAHLNRLQINKMIRYFEFLIKKDEIGFSNYNLGGVSYELTENLGEMVDYGLLDQDERGKYVMSDEGELAGRELLEEFSKHGHELLKKSYTILRDLSDEELLFFMYKTIPKTQEKSIIMDKLMKKSVQLVQSIYDKGKISASTALSWVRDEDKDALEFDLNPDYIAKLKARRKEATISSTDRDCFCR